MSAQRAALYVSIAALGILGFVLFAHPQLPLFGDYPEWTYHGVLLRDALRGHPDRAYWLKNYPVPNSLTTIGLGVLMLAMPWTVAARVWLLVEVGLGIWCASRLQRAAGVEQGWQLLVVTAGALLGINFWYGFVNFQFSTYLAMLMCALLLERVETRWGYGVLLILLFFSHMIPFTFCACALILYAWQYQRFNLLWQGIPSVLLCCWYVLGRFSQGNMDAKAGMQSSVVYASLDFVGYRINTYLKCWGFVNPSLTSHDSLLLGLVHAKGFLLFFVMDVVIGAALLVMIVSGMAGRVLRGGPARFFWLSVVMFAVGGMLMPGAAAGISDPGGRMVELSLWCAACAVSAPRQWVAGVVALCAMCLTGLSLYQVITFAVRWPPPTTGATGIGLPAAMRQFGHVGYAVRAYDYDRIRRGQMDADIYPTAMFLKKPAS